MRPIDGLICGICGERLDSRYAISADGIARCGNCERAEPLFAKATAYGSYDAGLRELIQLLKYEQIRPAAKVLGRMLAEAAAPLALDFGDAPPVVIPVPLHASKLRQRGFNQSELIARAALKHGIGAGTLPLNVSVLERCRPTESQTGLTRHQRRDEIAGRNILLVDDVFTTGTTVSECARVLRRAGANSVWVATVARVLKPEVTFAEPDFDEEDVAGEPMAMAARV